MKITAVVENKTNCELAVRHGLSLYIETKRHKILFDLGPDDTLFKNADLLGVDLHAVDTVIISHGHKDHGGALGRFLKINSSAKIYVQKQAFAPYYSKILFKKVRIGIDEAFKSHPQIVLLEGDYRIDEELSLFVARGAPKCYSKANDTLYAQGIKDDFLHEHSLIIQEDCTALIMGCGHTGIVNIMEKATAYRPRLCVGGYHLFNPTTRKTVSAALLNSIAQELRQYPDVQFYTCHCTGERAFAYLSQQMPNLFYLSCGQTLEA